jgi:hypothetical protein
MSAKITSVEALHLRLGRVEQKRRHPGGAAGPGDHRYGLTGHGEAVSNATVARSIVEAPRSAPFAMGLASG